MCSTELPKMSLLVQYDDLCRKSKVLTSGCEEKFKIFVENQLNCVSKWKKVDAENKRLRSKITDLESENKCLDTSIKHLKNLLEEANSVRKKIEFDKKCLERTIAAVRDVISSGGVIDNQTREKLAFLNSGCGQSSSQARLQTIEESVESLFSLSDLDQTEDDLNNYRRSSNRQTRHSKGKRSSSEETRTLLKKKKWDDAEEYLNKINKKVDLQSNSETNSTSPDIPVVSEPAQLRIDAYDQKYETDSTDTAVSRQSSVKLVNKSHKFVTKKYLKNIKCKACRQTISYFKQSLKCQFCGIFYHPECVSKCSMLCSPIINTPTNDTTGRVADYTSSSSPMIPPLTVEGTPENLSTPKGKFLGPIYSSVTKRKSLSQTPKKTLLTKKNSKSNHKPMRFAS